MSLSTHHLGHPGASPFLTGIREALQQQLTLETGRVATERAAVFSRLSTGRIVQAWLPIADAALNDVG